MKKLTILGILLLSYGLTIAQTYSPPKDYELKKNEDYAKYEPDVIEAFDFLMEARPLKNVSKRKAAMRFIIEWATGSPNVTITLFEGLNPSMDGEYLCILFGGWIKTALTADDEITTYDGYLGGINAVLDYYAKNKEILGTSKSIEKFVKLKKKGKLESFIKSKIES